MLVSSHGPGISMLPEAVRDAGFRPMAVLGRAAANDVLTRLRPQLDGLCQVDDPTDPRALADAAIMMCGGTPAAILSVHDGTIVPAAAAAALVGLPAAPAAALSRARHKYAARRALAAAGLAGPRFALLDSAEAAASVAEQVGLPAVVKPVNGSGSNLVRRVSDVAGLATAYRDLAAAAPGALGGMYDRMLVDPDTETPLDPTRVFLAESMLTGREYSVELVVRDGEPEPVLVLDKFLVDRDHFECGFCWPPLELAAERVAGLAATAVAAARALGLDRTLAHVELYDDPRLGPTVVEVNAGRGGGQLIGPLTAVATGVDPRAELIALATGAPRPERGTPKLPPPLATLTVFGHESGRLVAIEGLDEARDHPDVISTVVATAIGERLDHSYETFPINFLVAGLETRDELSQTYQELADTVHLVVEP
ncbi:hypothetical protein Athai_48820 [Actinocatenispora thailandica]|uniref:ATP-grasp domain-containing protein n=1 Tax=Actinocatenispora thailandica TaxID=227318 RepID=A0A7R7DT64_9ACTN|nr:hypothetical protein Athai_48820 [Actinocatenispora thailandica]